MHTSSVNYLNFCNLLSKLCAVIYIAIHTFVYRIYSNLVLSRSGLDNQFREEKNIGLKARVYQQKCNRF